MSEFTDPQRLDFLLQWSSTARFGIAGGPAEITLLDLGGKRYQGGDERDVLDQAMRDHRHLVPDVPKAETQATDPLGYRLPDALHEAIEAYGCAHVVEDGRSDARWQADCDEKKALLVTEIRRYAATAASEVDRRDAERLRALVRHKISLERTEGPSMAGHSVNWAGHRQPPDGQEHRGQIRHSGVDTVARGDLVPTAWNHPPVSELQALRQAIDQVVTNAERAAATAASKEP